MNKLKLKHLLTIENVNKLYDYYRNIHEENIIFQFQTVYQTFDNLELFPANMPFEIEGKASVITITLSEITFHLMKNNINFVIIKLDTDENIRKHFKEIGFYSKKV